MHGCCLALCAGEFDNAGAMMSVDDTLMCSFQILKPAEKRHKYSYGGADGNTVTPPHGFHAYEYKQLCLKGFAFM